MQNRSKIDVKINAETRMGREPNFDRFWIDLGAILASQNGAERVQSGPQRPKGQNGAKRTQHEAKRTPTEPKGHQRGAKREA